MSGRERAVAVVTGATGGMGQVIALELARRDLHVVTIARNPGRADHLRQQVAHIGGQATLEVIAGELSTVAGIRAAAAAIAGRHPSVNVLVNNAGAHFAEHRLSSDGLEMHIAVDYLAAYGLSTLLESQLRRGRARVVNVASDTLRDTRRIKLLGPARPATLDPGSLDDLTTLNPRTGFVPFEAYARAKLLTVMAGYDLARSLEGEVTVNAVHPGIVATDIIDDLVPSPIRVFAPLIRRALLTPAEGAAAAIRLATDPALNRISGRYFVRDAETPTPAVTHERDLQHRLRATSDILLAATKTNVNAR